MEGNLRANSYGIFFRRLSFRFLFTYFFLFTFPYKSWFKQVFWNDLIVWAGDLLGVGYVIDIKSNGSGDTTYAYVQVFCMLIISFIATLAWTLSDHKRTNDKTLTYWALVYVRYYLAFILLTYGFAKIFPTQFPLPSLLRLVQNYGDSSPMGLAWTFMGYSPGFSMFTGLAEALAGFLLFFRRTTTFGALFSITVLSNVVAMNFFYDIPVKLFSVHLLVMAIFIISPEIPRLIRFFFTNRKLPSEVTPPTLPKKWMRITRIALKAVVIPGIIGMQVNSNFKISKTIRKISSAPLYGIYKVKSFERNTKLIPPLATDSTRWDMLVIYRKDYAAIRTMDGKTSHHRFVVDTTSTQIKWEDTTTLTYNEAGDDLRMQGRINNDSLTIRLEKKDPQEFLLMSRGFHWINEYPLNR